MPSQPPALAALLAAAHACAGQLPETDHVEVIWRSADGAVRLHLDLAGALPPAAPVVLPLAALNLNEIERDVVEAIGRDTLKGEQVADRSGYPYDSGLKAVLAGLRRRGILTGSSGESGYGVATPYLPSA